jgi:ATP-dependent helicase IRC3
MLFSALRGLRACGRSRELSVAHLRCGFILRDHDHRQPRFERFSLPKRFQTNGLRHAMSQVGVDTDTSSLNVKTYGHPATVTLRPYQETAITSCLHALASGLTRIGVSSPTGSGKTTMFMSLIPQVPASSERTRTLIIVSSVELAGQAEVAAKRLLGPSWTVEVEQGKRTASGTADV